MFCFFIHFSLSSRSEMLLPEERWTTIGLRIAKRCFLREIPRWGRASTDGAASGSYPTARRSVIATDSSSLRDGRFLNLVCSTTWFLKPCNPRSNVFECWWKFCQSKSYYIVVHIFIHHCTVPRDHLLLDSAPDIGPLISCWKLDKFKNCWNKSFRTSKILTLLYQQFPNLLISQQDFF